MINKKITVLYVHANNNDIGGADYCLFNLVKELDVDRFNAIVCLSVRTEVVDWYEKVGIKIYLIDMMRIKKTLNLLYLVKMGMKFIPTLLQLKKIIKTENVDLVHGNDLLDIYGPIAGKISGLPVLQHVRMIIVSPNWLRVMLAKLVHSVNNVVITVSHGVSDGMFSSNGRVKNKVKVCYDWIDIHMGNEGIEQQDIRKKFKIPNDAVLIGHVGRLEPWKGQDVFVKAASTILKTHPNTYYLVVGGKVCGRGRERYGEEIKALVDDFGIQENVKFTGHRRDVANIMKSLDIFVHSSVTPEPFGLVAMEAQFFKRPVVGVNAGGIPEIIEDGVTGHLFKMGDDDDLANKVISLLDDKDRAQEMGELGYKRIIKIFDKKKLCKKIENVYAELVKDK